MRKVLLAGAALGALTLVDAPAFAQRVDSAQPYAPSAGAPTLRTEPGVQVRLAGRYRFFAGAVSQDFDDSATGKTSSVDFMDYARLWPGFDAMAANGLQYGAQLEIRMQDGSAARGNNRGSLTYRRMYGYVATPTMGEVRVGSGQTGAVERMYTGHIMGSIASGLWDGDVPPMIIGSSSNAATYWYSASGGNNQTKIAYFSPRFAGFDFGVSYAPNNGNFGGDAGCSTVGANCDRLSESSNSVDTLKMRNLIEAMARYRGTFGPVALNVSGGIYFADTVGAMGNAVASQNVRLYVFGTQVSVAGFTLGGIVTGGDANYASQTFGTGVNSNRVVSRSFSGLNPLTTAAGGFDDGLLTWQVGLSYTTGPYTVGAAYSQNLYEGSQAVATNARDQSLGIGASYAVAPGFSLFAEYLYGRRKEAGVDLTTGRAGNSNNAGDASVFAIGTSFNW